MDSHNRRFFSFLILSGILLGSAAAAGPGKTVNGMDVFYGVVPAELIKNQADVHDPKMHGGKRPGGGVQHLVVSVLDSTTGKHIGDATVIAIVTPLGLASQEKRLDPMEINQTVTYGNFFDFPPSSAPFRIVLKIARPNIPTHNPSTVEFEYTPPGNR